MRSSLTAVAVLLGPLFAVGCGETPAPTIPTSVAPGTASSASSVTVAALSAQDPTVIAVTFSGATVDVVVAILKGIDNASRNGNADFGLHVTVTYISQNNTVETLDSGRKSIKNDTTFLADIDNNTVSLLLSLQLEGLPPPGPNPGFIATAEILHP